MSEYQEAETLTIHSMLFRGTPEQYTRIRSRMVRLPAYLEWHRLDTLRSMHHVSAETPSGWALQSDFAHTIAPKLAAADRDVSLAVAAFIEEELGG